MIIFIRAELNQEVGYGHLIRSLLIAKTLRSKHKGLKIIFLTNDSINSISKIRECNFDFLSSSTRNEEEFLLSSTIRYGADILFIDKLYPYSAEFILNLKKHCKVVLFNHLCNGAYLCDAVIIPTNHSDTETAYYKNLQNKRVKYYEGMDYVVLNEKITRLRKSKRKNKEVLKLVITTGGSDPSGVMLKILAWMSQMDIRNMNVYALIGESFVHHKAIESIKKKLNDKIIITKYNVNYFKDADIAISNFGVSTYELIYLELVILSISHCEQNAKGSGILAKKCDQLIDLGNIENLNFEKFDNGLSNAITALTNEQLNYCSMDGLGVNRVAEIIFNLGKKN